MGSTVGESSVTRIARRLSMLILSRRKDEGIRIGENVRVSIHKVVGGRVYLSIEAPRDTVILRDEVEDREKRKES